MHSDTVTRDPEAHCWTIHPWPSPEGAAWWCMYTASGSWKYPSPCMSSRLSGDVTHSAIEILWTKWSHVTHRVEALNTSQILNVCHIYPCVCPTRKIRVLKWPQLLKLTKCCHHLTFIPCWLPCLFEQEKNWNNLHLLHFHQISERFINCFDMTEGLLGTEFLCLLIHNNDAES